MSMRISELARRTGVPVPTIKYYLREGLLPAGRPSAPNQAAYDDAHVHRLRLIRLLVEIGGSSIAQVRAVLAAVADPTVPVHDMLGVAHTALAGRVVPGSAPDPAAVTMVDEALADAGWSVDRGTPARRELEAAVGALVRLGWPITAGTLRPYAAAVDELAAGEVAFVRRQADRAAMVERMVVGTIVFDAVLSAMRRLAQEHHSSRSPRADRPARRERPHRGRRP